MLKDILIGRNSLVKFFYDLLFLYPAPANLTYLWNFGVYSILALVVRILTGILLAMHYVPYLDYAFLSVEHIMRNVNYGWLLRYVHANGASLFFIVVYIHIFRGLFFGSFMHPRQLLWIVGVIIFILMIVTAFFGYVLPWGRMSFWAATVITNLFSAIPVVGSDLVLWLWSGYSVSGATLTKFFSLHFVFPFVILALVLFHIYLLHLNGSNNPLGVNMVNIDSVSFFPYYSSKDIFGLVFYIYLAITVILLFPNLLGHSDNYIQANPMITPSHIVPEWYLLPFYAILRAIPNKLLGVAAMGSSIVLLALLPFLFKANTRSMKFRPLSRSLFWFFLVVLYQLGIIGGKVAEYPYIQFGQFLTLFYFSYFLVLGPSVIFLENSFWNNSKKI
jgi:ubiquinol-cytochrome c reductase cytochrome b subunit